MLNRKIKTSALFALMIALLLPTAAQAVDIPLLTWERGRQQQIVIAEGSLNRQWSVVLEGNGRRELPFIGSSKDSRGYVVFSISLPDDLPLGAYSVYATQAGKERNLIAGVNVTPATSRTAASNLVNLSIILMIFIFLTSIVSTIRARKYSYIPFQSTQVLPKITDPIVDEEENFWDRLETAPYRLRVQWLNAFKPSLLRFLLIREGEMLHRLNKNTYGLAPLVGLIAGFVTAIQVEKDGGIAQASTTFFLIVALVGILDAFSGIAATLGFWAIQLSLGNVTSFRDILISISIGISWVAPSLFATLLRETISRDITPTTSRTEDPIRVVGVVGSALVGALAFTLGQLLLQGVIYIERENLNISAFHVGLAALALVTRGFADVLKLHSGSEENLRDESFYIARVTAPSTALVVSLIVLGFTYIWTGSLPKAFFVAVIFSLPYLFSFVRFEKRDRIQITRFPRNILLEGLLLVAISFIVFRQISISPILLEKRVELLLLLAGIAPALHAAYSAIYASNEEEFSFEGNPEIIEP